ncbi:hypothetical protein Scep_027571 [Stephania cephalantha]|uniref:non-specific serine/threonine protein kinase n=1 Tax=Stephania cephalantha TaxID=152367 RepID=A0AAP0E8B7_9MAGN
MMLLESQPDSCDQVDVLNSSKSSVSCDGSSYCSRLSFDTSTLATTTTMSPSPENSTFTKPPHRSSSDSAWEAIRSAAERRPTGVLSFSDFKLIRQIGSGDIGTVYLCCLKEQDSNVNNTFNSHLYAMKVVDKQALAVKKKMNRAETEKRILKMLDHPFLPTLYTDFEASHFSCVVMEFCSAGDLHSLRHKQPGKRFSISSARFYAAEVLVALEYLHMLGIVYRDLKPENILVRSDGHIMLSDFDLSLCSDAIPTVHSPDSSPEIRTTATATLSTTRCRKLKPSAAALACLCKRFFRSRKVRSTEAELRQFVAEPVTARSCSFVGTHEYVAPEVAAGKSHGNAVDWWALGIFIYELIYGYTPFSGKTNEATLQNILKKPLIFPAPVSSGSEIYARSLISGLLAKDPESRLGAKRGAADVKTHPFFKGLNFALIRSAAPPGLPSLRRVRTATFYSGSSIKKNACMGFEYF